MRGAALALDGVVVHVVARKAVERRDEVGADTLRREIIVIGDPRVGRPGAAVGAHDRPRHGFDAAADGRVATAPVMICAAAALTASSADAQKRWTCWPATLSA